jgi:hypothetical protein
MMLCRETDARPEHSRSRAPGETDDTALSPARRIRCRTCREAVSQRESVFSPSGGASRHVFANPAGRVFEILTVREAAIRPWGEPTQEHTWFPGFAWRVGLCAACQAHLGWRFDPVAEGPAFFGLITTEIEEE